MTKEYHLKLEILTLWFREMQNSVAKVVEKTRADVDVASSSSSPMSILALHGNLEASQAIPRLA